MRKQSGLLSAALIMSLLLGACAKQEARETEPVAPVQVAEARNDTIRRMVTADAVLHPLSQSSVVPKISAPVRAFYVNRGDHVRQGQLLAALENRDLTAAAEESRGAYEQAEANFRNTSGASVPVEEEKARADVEAAREALDAARKLHESRQKLYQEGALARKLVDEAAVALAQAQSQFDTAQKHLTTLRSVGRQEEIKGAEAQLESARGKYQGAQAMLSYSEIHSPLTGVITDRAIYPGEMASAGTPLLTIMDISSIVARANVPETQAAFLKVGDPATITAPGITVAHPGKVTVVSPAVDPNTTTIQVWVQAANPGEQLRPGVTARVSILAQTIPNALIIPPSAILPGEEGGTIVMVVGADSIAHTRKITTGIREADKVQVLSGLSAGERVVTVGGLGLSDNTKVRIEKHD